MTSTRLIAIGLLLVSLTTRAAPELTDAERDLHAERTTDGNAYLDQDPGLYVLLRNAASWKADDFSGERGAAVAPPPDYDFIKNNPAQARGNTYLLEGWVAAHDRFPSAKDKLGREKLHNTSDPAWGEQVTRWTIVTDKKDPASTIIVLFTDPRGQMPQPGKDQQARIAARFHKLWTIKDVNGKPFTYPVFVGGAAELVNANASSTGGEGGVPRTVLIFVVVGAAGAFFGVRILLNRMNASGRARTSAMLESRRRERELSGIEDEEEDEELPADPSAALEVLSKRHGQPD